DATVTGVQTCALPIFRKYIGIFYKLSLKLPAKILNMLYFSLIYPRLLYGIEVYANTYLCHLHNLIVLNNRLLRIIQHKSLVTSRSEERRVGKEYSSKV